MAVNLVPGSSVDVTGDFNLSGDSSFTLVPGSHRMADLNQTQPTRLSRTPLCTNRLWCLISAQKSKALSLDLRIT